jgi:hypothetical protein
MRRKRAAQEAPPATPPTITIRFDAMFISCFRDYFLIQRLFPYSEPDCVSPVRKGANRAGTARLLILDALGIFQSLCILSFPMTLTILQSHKKMYHSISSQARTSTCQPV